METNFDLKIGFKCNNDCIHCVVADKRSSGNLKLEDIYKTIDNNSDVKVITITGGEPSGYDYLPDILRYIKGKHIETVIQTNATGFANKDFCKECAPYIDHAHVAIHSYDEKVHDDIVRCSGMWKKTMEGYKNLLSNNIFCTTQTVISNYNINTLYDTYKMIQDIYPGTIMSMTYPHMMGNALKNIDKVAFRYSDKKDIIHKCLKDFGKHLFLESIPLCYIYPYQNDIFDSLESIISSHAYERKGYDFSDCKNIKNYNVLDIQERRKAPKCRECIFNNKCIGVWKEYIYHFKDKLDLYPIKEL